MTNSSVVLARRFQKLGMLRILYNKYPRFMDLEISKHYLPTIWVGVTCKLYSRKDLNLLDFGLTANEDLAFTYYDLASKRYVGCDNRVIYVQRFSHDGLSKNYICGNLDYLDNTLKPLEIEKNYL